LAKERGFKGYECLSYVELEYAIDESIVLDHLVSKVLDSVKSVAAK